MSQGQNLWYERKDLITRNIHVKYESPTYNGSKVKANVRIFRYVKGHSHVHKVTNFGISGKASS